MKGQFPAVFNLTDLNGQNGFKLDGEATNDFSGNSVSAAGDINGDGYADLVIGAWGHAGGVGRSYVVFGGPNVGVGGLVPLSILNGTNGFKLDGEAGNDSSGYSVSTAGDINDDGRVDLLIGAVGYATRTGRSYVVFGGPTVGNGGMIALSSLNGANGFKLDGENMGDQSGFSVSTAGDINNDGHADLVIGAYGYPGSTKSHGYLVFGGPGVSSGGVFNLSNLNGTNGFKLIEENDLDWSGHSVSATGDINSDGRADLVIGAYGYLQGANKGRSYVLFGGTGVGSSGVFNLSSLNGATGFKLDGENSNGDSSGWVVSAAGDINGDGHADLLIGAPNYPASANKGRSYIVFGGAGVGSSGLFNLSSLNGVNGFKLDGETDGDYSGGSVSAAGDINGDGWDDLLIGADGYPGSSHNGRSYLVFGGHWVGRSGVFNLSSLNGANGFKLNAEATNDFSGNSVSAAGDINGDGVADILIGAYSHNNLIGRSYVVFGDAPPVLVNNSLSLSVGAAITLNSTFLAATDRNHPNNTLVFVPGAVEHGQFEAVGAPGIPLSNFTQQQVVDGTIQFVHDGALVAPHYDITVRSEGIAWVGPLAAKINFIGTPPSYFPAVLPLSSLNGQNGFKLDGEPPSHSGYSVSTAGDINGDGVSDLLIGAPWHTSITGRSYVVFGGSGVGSSGLVVLSGLNGSMGFKLDGEATIEFSGYSVDAAGDINCDGVADLLIGAYCHASCAGRSYVVFGGPGVGGSGLVALSGLNGNNGFKLDGETTNDCSGYSVSGIVDINGDGVSDLLIGAYYHASQVGRSYVVFGGLGVGSSGLVMLSGLNGNNGFKLDGEATSDWSGSSVSAEDINGDGVSDLLIGAYKHANATGRSYVVFGGPGVGGSGLVALSGLNGSTGFKLDGESSSDWSGYSVSTAGDINGDGVADLLIGAPHHANNTGCSYVVFGGPGVGGSGLVALSGLNGSTGFKLDGEASGDYSGWSVSTAGDINGDGVSDLLIGAYGHMSNTGRSYVVFGGPAVSGSGLLTLSGLNGSTGFKLDGEASPDCSGYSVSAAGDINGDGVSDLLIGAYGHMSQWGRSYVVFGDIPPILVSNRLSLSVGATIPLNATFLAAYDRNHNNSSIIFFPANVTQGYFESTAQPGVSITNFTQMQLGNGTIQFVHDGSAFAPSYNITVRSDGIAWTGPSVANITFIPAVTTTVVSTSSTTQTPTSSVSGTSTPSTSPSPTSVSGTPTPLVTPTPTSVSASPVLLNNQLMLSNGQTVMLSGNNLQASETGFNNSQLIFIVSNVQNGYFSTVPSSNNLSKNVTSFTQAQIQNGAVEFIHNGDKQAPSYSVIVSDGVRSSVPNIATIDFIGAPVITQNSVNVTTGNTITLTSAMLNVTAPSGVTASQISLTVTHLQHATMTSTVTQAPVNQFTLADVEAGDIQLTPDSSLITPSYAITATVILTALSSAPNAAAVLFSDQGVYAPRVVNNYLEVTQGKATLLSNRYLSAEQPNGPLLGNNTVYYISDTTHGHFSLISQPQTWISFFNQGQLSGGQVQFVQDGSLSTPGYSSAVRAFGLQSASQPAGIYFTVLNEPSSTPTSSAIESGYSTIQKAIIGASISGGIGIGFALVQICLKRLANRKLLQALGEGANDYDQNVVRPVAQEIAGRVKITGFLNATTNIRMRSFKSAVRSLLSALSARGVDLDFKKMRASERDALINEIGNQTYRWVKSKRRGCAACCPGFSSFFKPQIVPENLQDAAGEIADSVVLALSRNRSQVRMSQHLSISGSPVFAEPSGKRSVEMDEISSVSQKGDDLKEQPLENPSVVQLG